MIPSGVMPLIDIPPFGLLPPPGVVGVVGVGQCAASACRLISFLFLLLPGGLLVALPPESDVGVGHTMRPSNPLISTFGW